MRVNITKAKSSMPSFLILLIKRLQDIRNGFWPVCLALLILKFRNQNPSTYQEKMRYKLAYDRRQILSFWADKVTARDYVAEKIGPEYLTKSIGILTSGKEINKIDLPRNFVIKANHGSGALVIVSETAPLENLLPSKLSKVTWQRYLVHPDSVDMEHLVCLSEKWMQLNFYNSVGHFPEWAYKNISPRILVEELLLVNEKIASDYRFFIFNGVCEYVEVDSSWHENPTRNMFNMDWEPIAIKLKFPPAVPAPSKPVHFDLMVKLAETLADGIDHVRIDFYLLGDRIVFGEMTNYHTSGDQVFLPHEFNFEFGKNWNPKSHY
jgi:hypothetical protein